MQERSKVYLVAWLVMLVVIAVGFWPSYFGLLGGEGLDKEWFIHMHAVVMVVWMGLFGAQAALVATNRVALHRRLGQFTAGWGVLLLIVGVMTAVLRFGSRHAEGMVDVARQFVIWPLTDMVVFAAVFFPALAYRRQPEVHKRLMVVATTALIVAAAARIVAPSSLLMHFLFVAIWLSPLFLLMAHDYLTQRRLHRAYVVGFAVLFVSSFRYAVTDSGPWIAFTDWLARVVA